MYDVFGLMFAICKNELNNPIDWLMTLTLEKLVSDATVYCKKTSVSAYPPHPFMEYETSTADNPFVWFVNVGTVDEIVAASIGCNGLIFFGLETTLAKFVYFFVEMKVYSVLNKSPFAVYSNVDGLYEIPIL